MKAVFDKKYIVNLTPNNLKPAATRYEYAQELIKDIEMFKEENNCSRLVMIWCGSTEVYSKASIVHQTIESLEDGLKNDNQAIPPSMIYAYAALKSGVPFANGSPNLTCDVPAMVALAQILKDTSSVMLIKKSIDYIYNYQFKDAEQACSEISILFPGHPVEYLLKGMITYWENFPLLTNSPARVLFEKDLRTCIEICEKIPDSIDEPEYLLTNLCAR